MIPAAVKPLPAESVTWPVADLPRNIKPLTTQAELWGYGVRLLTFVQVSSIEEAIREAGIRKCYLLKSPILTNVWYVIFPVVEVTDY